MGRVVISLHGIRTRGVWQKDLVPSLARDRFVPVPLDYGYFSAFKFLFPWSRRKKVEWLREQIERIPEVQQGERPSIIAHSFGTYLVAQLLEKYPMIKVDKLVFAGGIVRSDFDWPKLLEASQVNLLRNDYGRLDPWPGFARMFVSDTGDSGSVGYSLPHDLLFQKEFRKYKHSDYFHESHFRLEWIPILKSLVLGVRIVITPIIQARLREVMSLAVQGVARRLQIDSTFLRANIFVRDESDRLSIPEGLHHNMCNGRELTISIAIGDGCTGRAYLQRRSLIAVFDENWGRYTLPDPELEKVDKRVRWIISTPIEDRRQTDRLFGVLNVDCLCVSHKETDLQRLPPYLRGWSKVLGEQLIISTE